MLWAELRHEQAVPFGLSVIPTATNYAFQKTSQARGNFVGNVQQDTSHVPFFSQPDVLAKVLEGL